MIADCTPSARVFTMRHSARLFWLLTVVPCLTAASGCSTQREPARRVAEVAKVAEVEEPVLDDILKTSPKLVPPSPPTPEDSKAPPPVVKPPVRALPVELVNS